MGKLLNSYIPFFFVFLCLAFFHSRGIVYHDEGYILNSASRLLHGEIPYRDFHFAYTPGSIYATAIAFTLFGESILSSRILMLAISFGSSILIYKTTYIITKKRLFSFCAVLVYLAWGPSHTNFAWPIMFCLFTTISTCYLFLLGETKHKNRLFLFAGIMTISTFLFKQNFGLGFLLVSLCYFLFSHYKAKRQAFLWYLFGAALSSMFFIICLITTSSFFPFMNDFYIYTLQRILIDHTLDTSFFYGNTLVEKIAKTIFYVSPLLSGTIAIGMLFKQYRQFLFLPFFCIVFYLSGIRPTTDYNHLAPLLSLSGTSLLIVVYLLKKPSYKLFFSSIIMVLIFVGFYTALYKGYYRWQKPLSENNYFISSPKVFIWSDDTDATRIPQLTQLTQSQKNERQFLFVNDYMPMLYFLTNTKNPTKFDLLDGIAIFYRPYTKEIFSDIHNKKTPYIITFHSYNGSFGIEFIKKSYIPQKDIAEFTVWKSM